MRIIVRIFSLSIVSLLVLMTVMNLFEENIHLDELNKISSLAMTNTQIIIQENIEDRLYKTANARMVIKDNEDYLDLYRFHLDKLVNTSGKYYIKDYYADYYKGLLYVDVVHEYKSIDGTKKILEKKLINLIDIKDYEKEI